MKTSGFRKNSPSLKLGGKHYYISYPKALTAKPARAHGIIYPIRWDALPFCQLLYGWPPLSTGRWRNHLFYRFSALPLRITLLTLPSSSLLASLLIGCFPPSLSSIPTSRWPITNKHCKKNKKVCLRLRSCVLLATKWLPCFRSSQPPGGICGAMIRGKKKGCDAPPAEAQALPEQNGHRVDPEMGLRILLGHV